MTTLRVVRPFVRLTPLLASLVVCAFATPPSSAAGCAHPSADNATARAAATLQILEIADAAPADLGLPGKPCNGPRCRSKAPAADAPPAPVALPDRHESLAPTRAVTTPPSSTTLGRTEPLLSPICIVTPLERPPRGV